MILRLKKINTFSQELIKPQKPNNPRIIRLTLKAYVCSRDYDMETQDNQRAIECLRSLRALSSSLSKTSQIDTAKHDSREVLHNTK